MKIKAQGDRENAEICDLVGEIVRSLELLILKAGKLQGMLNIPQDAEDFSDDDQ